MPMKKTSPPVRELTAEQKAAKLTALGLIDFWRITGAELIRAGVPAVPAETKGARSRTGPKRTPAELLTPELRLVLNQCRHLANFWGVTPQALISAGAPLRSAVTAVTSDPGPRPDAKTYRHPITQETWNGVGAQPGWLKRALLNEGYTVRELLA